MPHFSSAVLFIAALTSMSMYSQAFTSSEVRVSSVSRDTTTKNSLNPFGVSRQTFNKSPFSTMLNMGMVEDFLAGTDNEKRKAENESYLSTVSKRVEKINALEPTIEDLGDDELLAKTAEFRQRLASGEDINGPILEEAFAVVREAAW